MTLPGRQPAEQNQTVLVCLDTVEVAADHARPAPVQLWAHKAAELLDHARRSGWIVAHVLRLAPTGPERWRTVDGLSPRPFERVFHRDAPSAFSSTEFAALAAQHAELVLVGGSTVMTLLATACDGLKRGHRIAVASDALAAPNADRVRLAELAQVTADGEESRLVIQNTTRLLTGAPGLRLVQGGLMSFAPAVARRNGGGLET